LTDGEKEAGRDVATTMVVGETGGRSAPLPVPIRGKDAGRQVRGSADIE
jgi:hypothetical protein